MPNMDFSGVSMDQLKVPAFKNEEDMLSTFEAMCAGEVPFPIFFQAMGVDFTDHAYAAEAIRIGGIPFLSSAAPGFPILANDLSACSREERSEKFLDANDAAAAKQVEYVHERHPYAILGGNAMRKLTGFNRSLATYGQTKNVKILAAGAGILESDDIKQMQQFPWMELMPIVSSSIAARWTLRVAKQIGVRIRLLLVELPPSAGGHLGAANAEAAVKVEDFDPVKIREEIRKHFPNLPVVLAGGIAYRNQIKEALAMGYQGVGIGIRGLLTQESKLSDQLIKDFYLNPAYNVVTNDTSPTGYPGRYLDVPGHTQTREERIAYVRYAVRNCVSCIEPGSCLFLKNAADPDDKHFCIAQDLPRTRFGKPGGTCFVSTERDRIMHDPICKDAQGNPRVPTLEESTNYMLTHDAPPWPEQEGT